MIVSKGDVSAKKTVLTKPGELLSEDIFGWVLVDETPLLPEAEDTAGKRPDDAPHVHGIPVPHFVISQDALARGLGSDLPVDTGTAAQADLPPELVGFRPAPVAALPGGGGQGGTGFSIPAHASGGTSHHIPVQHPDLSGNLVLASHPHAPSVAALMAIGTEDHHVPLHITAVDGKNNANSVSVNVAGLPAGASLSVGHMNSQGIWVIPAGTGLSGLYLIPGANWFGHGMLDISAHQANGMVTHALMPYNVLPVQDQAVISGTDTGGTVEDGTRHAAGILQVTDPDPGEALFVPATIASPLGTFNIDANGRWSFDLNNGAPAVQSLSAGTTTPQVFSVFSKDGTSHQVTVSVTGTNDHPVLSSASATVHEDGAVVSGHMVSTDVDGGDSAHFAAGGVLPAGFALNADGSWTLDPSGSAYQSLGVGQHMVLRVPVTVTDGSGATDTQDLLITVTGTNDAPVVGGAVSLPAGTEDKPVVLTAQQLLGQATDVDGDQLSVSGLSVDHGSISANPDGSFTFTPDGNYVGPVAFGYTVTDGHGGVTPGVAGLVLSPVGDVAVITGGSVASVTEDHAVQGGALQSGGKLTVVDPDAGEAHFQGETITGPQGGQLVMATDGSWRYSIDNGLPAVQKLGAGVTVQEHFTVHSADGTTHEIVATVTGTNDRPVLSAASGAASEGGAVISGQMSVVDVDGGDTARFGTGVALPAGFALAPDGGWTFDPSGAAYQSLGVGQTMDLRIPVTVTDSAGATDTQDLVITVTGTNDGPVLQSAVGSAREDGAIASGRMVGTDPDGTDQLHYTTTSTQAGFAMQPDGQWTLDPTDNAYQSLRAGETQTLVIPVSVSDGHGGSATSNLTITVTGTNDGPVLSASTAGVAEDAKPISGQMQATDADVGDKMVFSAVNRPAGFVLQKDGGWSFDPSGSAYQSLGVGQQMVLRVPVTVTDGSGATSTQDLEITVTGTNDHPVLSSASATVHEDGAVVSGHMVSTDVDGGDSAHFAAGGVLPAGFALNADGSWTLDPSGSAYQSLGVGQHMVLRVPVTVTDGSGATDTQDLLITVTGTNDAPVVGGAVSLPAGTEDKPVVLTAQQLLGQATDVDGDQLSVSGLSVDHGSISANPDGSFTFTPDGNYVGPVAFGYTVTDGHGGVTPGVAGLVLSPVGDVAVITGGSVASVTEDHAVQGGALQSGGKLTVVDPDAGEAHFQGETITGPQGGQLVMATDGSWRYSIDNGLPAVQKLGAGVTVQEHFTVHSADGTTHEIVATVTGTNDRPVLSAASGAASEGGAVISGQMSVVDVDGGDTARFGTGVALPAGFALAPDGGWTFDPSGAAYQSLGVGQTMDLRIPVTVTDSAGATDTQDLVITVTGTNDGPVLQSAVGSAREDGAIASGRMVGTDPDGTDQLHYTTTSTQAGFAMQPDGQWTLDPTDNAYQSLRAGETQTLVIPVSVSDGHGGSATSNLTITVTGTNDGPVLSASTAGVAEDAKPISGQMQATDADVGDKMVFSAVNRPAGFVLQKDGGWSFDPSGSAYQSLGVGQQMVLRVPVTVTDGSGATSTQDLEITVTGTNDHPVLSSASATVHEDGAVVSGHMVSTDVDGGDSAHFAAGGVLPAGFALNADGSWTLDPSGSAYQSLGVGQHMVLRVPVTVTDGSGATDTQDLLITVTGTNDAPVVGGAVSLPAGTEDKPVVLTAQQLLGQATDVDGDQLSVSGLSVDHGSISANPDGSFTFTPDGNYVGPVAFGYTVTDGHGGVTPGVAGLVLSPVGDVAVITGGSVASVTEDHAVQGGALQSGGKLTVVDPDAGEAHFQGETITGPQGGQLVMATDGSWRYSIDNGLPAVQKLGAGVTVQEHFTVHSADGTTHEIVATVTGTNDRPVLSAASGAASEGGAVISGQMSVVDVDGGDTARFGTGVALPAGFALAPDGGWTFDPSGAAYQSLGVGQTMDLRIPVTVTDSAGATDTQDLVITVTGTNDGPVLQSAVGSAREDGAIASGRMVGTDPDGTDQLHYTTTSTQAGFAMQPDGQWTLDPTDNAYQSLRAGETQTLVIPVSVSDGHGGSATSNLTITVTGTNDGPVLSASTAGVAEDAKPISGQMQATDADVGDKMVFSAVNRPAGFVLQKDGGWSFDPSGSAYQSLGVGQQMVLRVPVTVTDGSGATSTQDLEITVTGTNDHPVLSSASATVHEDGAVVSGHMVSTDVDGGDSAHFAAGGVLPAGFALNADGSWTLDPSGSAYQSLGVGQHMVLRVPVTVTDGSGATDTQDLLITVTGTNDAPVVGGAVSLPAGTEDKPVVLTAQQLLGQATDVDGDQLSVSGLSVDHGSISANPDGSFTFTPDGNYVGPVAFGYTVTDGHGGVTPGVAGLVLSPVGDVAVITGGSVASVTEDHAVQGGALQSGGKLTVVDPDAGEAHFQGETITGPQGGQLVMATDGSWRYSIDNGLPAVQKLGAGVTVQEHFTVHSADGTTHEIVATVTGTNDRPVLSAASGAASEGGAVISGQMSVVDVDGGDTARFGTGVALPAGFALAPDGGWTFDPSGAAYQSLGVGQTMDLRIPVTVTDSAGATDTQDLVITVTGTNDGPVLQSAVGSAREDGAIASGRMVGTDPDGTDQLHYTTTSTQAGFAMQPDGQWTLDPTDNAYQSLRAGETQTLVIPVSVSDGHGGSATSNLTITVTGTNDGPVLSASTAGVAEDAKPISGQMQATDADVGDKMVFSAVNRPAGFVLQKDGGWSFDPSGSAYQSLGVGQQMVLRVPVTVTDGSGATSTQDLEITVTGTNDHPVLSSASATVHEDGAVVSGHMVSTDVDGGDSAHFAAGGVLPAGFALNADGSWTLDPSGSAYQSLGVGQHMVLRVPVTVTDGSGATDTQDLLITVTGTNDAPVVGGAVSLPAGTEDKPVVLTAQQLLGQATDVDGDQLSVSGLSVDHGSISANPDGSFTFTPDGNYVGPVAFGYTVTDGHGGVTPGVAGLVLSPVGDVAVITGGSVASVTEDHAVQGGALQSGGKLTVVDPDAGEAHFQGETITGPQGGQLVMATDGSWRYSIDNGLPAVQKLGAGVTVQEHFTVHSADGTTHEIVATVTGTNDRPVLSAASGAASEGGAVISGQMSVVDVDGGDTARFGTGVALPAGFALAPDGGWTFDPSGAAYQSLGVGQTMDLRIPVTVTDSAGATDTQDLVITVTGTNDGPVLQSAVGSAREDGAIASGRMVGTDPDGTDQLHYTTTSTQAGFAMQPDGQWTLDPTDNAYQSLRAGETQTLVIPVSVSDGHGGSATSNLTITVTGTNDGPVLSASTAGVAEDAKPISGQMQATDADVGDKMVFSAVNRPAGFVLQKDGGWSFDPSGSAYQSLGVGQQMVLRVPVTVTDGSGATSTQDLEITVTGTNDHPVLSSASATVHEDGAVVSGHMVSTDVDGGDSAHFAAGGVLPAGFALNADGSWTLDPSGSAYQSLGVGQHMVLRVPVTVTDGSGATDTQDLLITVTGTNDAPVVGGAVSLPAGTEDKPVVLTAQQLLGQATDVDGDQLSVSGLSVDHGSISANPDGSFTFTPDGNYVGPVAFGYTVTDGHGGVTPGVAGLVLSPVGDVAVITGGSVASVTEDHAVQGGALQSGGKLTVVDPDAGEAHFQGETITGPQGGQLVMATDGSWRYSIDNGLPAVQKLGAGVTVQEHFTVHSADGTTHEIVATVTGTNDRPVLSAASGAASEGGAVISGQMSVVDVDGGDTARFGTGVALPAGFALAPDGGWTFDPSGAAYQSLGVGQTMDLRIPVTVTDSAGATDTQDLVITVTGTNDGPVLQSAVGSAREDGAIASGRMVGTDPDGTDQLHYTTTSTQAGFAMQPDGQWTLDPTDNAYQSLRAGETQTLVIPVSVSDGHGGSATSNLTITVTGTNDGPVLSASTAGVAEDAKPISGQMQATDADVGDKMVFSAVNRPAGFVLQKDGGWSFDPSGSAYQSLGVGQQMVLRVPVTVTDGSGATSTQDLEITVTGTNDHPVLSSASATVHEDGAVVSGHMVSTDVDGGDSAHFAAGGVLPAGFALNADGSWTLDPSGSAYQSLGVGQHMVLRVPVTVTDGSGATDTQDLLITVTGTNDAPVVGGAVSLPAGTEDKPVVLTAQQLLGQATDVDGDQLSVSGLSVDHGSISANPDGSFTFTPDGNYVGPVAFGYTVTDGHGGVTPGVAGLVLSPVGDVAVITGGSVASVTEDHAVQGGALQSGGKLTVVDPDAGEAHFQGETITGPQGGQLVMATDGSWRYSIDNGLPAVQKLGAGVTVQEHFTVHSADGTTHEIVATVTGTNDRPVLSAASGAASEGGAVISGQMSVVDVDGGDTARFGTGVALPAGFALAPDGGWTFDPSGAAYQSLGVGQTMDLRIPVTVTDSAGATDTQDLVITVTGTNDGPVLQSAVGSAREDGAIASGRMVGTDPDGTDQLHYTTTSTQAGFAMQPDGQWTLDPTDNAYQSLRAGETQTLVIPVSVSDGHGGSATSNLTITVTGTNDGPVLSASTAGVAEDAKPISGQMQATDADVGDKMVFSAVNRPAGFVLQKDGGWSFDPSGSAYQSLGVGQQMVLRVPVTVTDGSGATSTQDLEITVTGTNDHPVLSSASATVHEDGAVVSGHMVSTDVDGGDSAHFAAGGVLPAGFALNADGSWTLDPSGSAYQSLGVGQHMVLRVPVTVTDGSGATDTQDLLITVTGTNDAPVVGGAVSLPAGTEDKPVVLTAQQLLGQATDVDGDQLSVSGLSVDHGSISANPDGSFTFTPDGNYVGPVAFGYTVTDGHGGVTPGVAGLVLSPVGDVAVITGGSVASVTEDHAVQGGALQSGGKLTVVDPDAGEAHFQGETITGPQGGQLVMATDGSWRYSIDNGLPAVQKLGAGVTVQEHFTVHSADGTTHEIVATVTGTNDRPVLSAASGAASEGGAVISGQMSVVDVDGGDTARFGTGVALPAGFALAPDGGWTFDPSGAAYQSLGVGQTMDLRIPVTVTDSAGATDTQDLVITVTGTNDGPVLQSAVGSAREDGAIASGRMVGTDPDGTDQLHYTTTSTQAGFAMQPDGQWTLDPTDNAYQSLRAGETQTLVIPVSVSDGHGGSATSNLTITVTGTNDAAVITGSSTGSVREDTLVTAGDLVATGTLRATDIDKGEDQFQAETVHSPNGGVLQIRANGVWEYSIDNALPAVQSLANGAVLLETFTVHSVDGTSHDITTAVTGRNDGPVLLAATSTATEDGSKVGGSMVATDADAGDRQTFTGANFPAGFVLNTDGAWTFDPTETAYQHLAEGQTQTLTIPVTVTDQDNATDTQNLVITITGTDDKAVVTGIDTGAVTEDTQPTTTGKLDVTDVDSGLPPVFAVEAGGVGQYGTLTIKPDGTWDYTLDNSRPDIQAMAVGNTRVDQVTVTATDAAGNITRHDILVTVTGTNDTPVVSGAVALPDSHEDTVVNISATQLLEHATDVDTTDTLSVAGLSASHGTISGDAANGFTFTPDPNYNGPISLSYTVTDGHGGSVAQTASMTLAAVGDAAVIGGVDTGSVTEGTAGQNMSPDYAQPGMATLSRAPLYANGQLTILDPDAGENQFDTRRAGMNYSGTYGDLRLNSDGSWHYFGDAGHIRDMGGRVTTRGTAIDQLGEGQTLTDTITIHAKDGTPHDIVITIHGSNDRPYCSSEVVLRPGAEDTRQTITLAQLLHNTVDVDANDAGKLSIANIHPDHGSILDNGNGTFTFTPEHNYNGAVHFTYDVTDAHGGVTHTGATTNLAAVGDAAIISGGDTGYVKEDVLLSASGDLRITDVDAGEEKFVAVTNAHAPGLAGTYSITESGHWTFHLNPAIQSYHENETVFEYFEVHSVDGTVHRINISFDGTGDVPVITGDLVATAVEDTKSVVTGTLVVTDPDWGQSGTDRTNYHQPLPSNNGYGHFEIDMDGHWKYTLDSSNVTVQSLGAGQPLTDTFTVTTLDGTKQAVTINITGTNDAPVVSGPVVLAGGTEDTVVKITAAQLLEHASDVDAGDTLSVSGVTANHGKVTGNVASGFTFTPDPNYNGPVTLSYSVTDSQGGTVAQSASMTLSATGDAAVITDYSTGFVKEDERVATYGQTHQLTATGMLSIVDPDAGENRFQYSQFGETAVSDPFGGNLHIDESGTWRYYVNNDNPRLQQLAEGQIEHAIYRVHSIDGTSHDIDVEVRGTNDAPTISASVKLSGGTEDKPVQITATQLLEHATDVDTTDTLSVAGLSASHGTISGDAANGFTFTPDANYNGAVSLNYTVTDGHGGTVAQSASMTLGASNDAAVITGQDTGNVTEDKAPGHHSIVGRITTTGDLVVKDLDGSIEEHFQAQTSVPGSNGYGDFTINQDGHWTYSANNQQTPIQQLNQGQTVTDTLTVLSTDGTTHQISITIHGTNDAPVLSAATATATEDGSAVSGQMSATDVDTGDTQAFSLGQNAPAGFTMNANGSWNFDPTDAAYQHLAAGQIQAITIPITVTDIEGTTDTKDLVLTISGTNDKPTLHVMGHAIQVHEDSVTHAGIGARDPDKTDQMTYTSVGAPAGFSIDPNHGRITMDASGSAYQHLASGQVEHLSIAVTATDSNGATSTRNVLIDITGTNDLPKISAPVVLPAGTEDTAVKITATQLIAHATDVDMGNTLSINGLSADHGTIIGDAATGFTFTPEANYNGPVSLNYNVTDGQGGWVPQTASMTLGATKDAAVITGVGASLKEDVGIGAFSGDPGDISAFGQFHVVDPDGAAESKFPDPGPSFQTYTGSLGGRLQVNPDGQYIYHLKNSIVDHLKTGEEAKDTFVIHSVDGTTHPVEFTIAGTNDAPVVYRNFVTKFEGESVFKGHISAGDLDHDDSTTLTFTSGAPVAGFNLNRDGSYTFDPSNAAYLHMKDGDHQIFSVPITVTDADGLSSTGSLQVQLLGQNDAPVLSSATASATEDGNAVSGQMLATDVDGGYYKRQYSLSQTAPAGFTMQGNGSWSFDPTDAAYQNLSAGATQQVTIPVTVTDKQGATDTENLVITVTGSNDGPVVSGSVTLPGGTEDTAVQITAAQLLEHATDVDTADHLSVIGLSASHGSITGDAATGFTFTPDANYNGPVQLSYSVTDGHGGTVAQTASMTLGATPDASVITGTDTGNVKEDTSASTAGKLDITDPDGGAAQFVPVANGQAPRNAGTYSIDVAGNWTFTLNPARQALHEGEVVTDYFEVQSVDGTLHRIGISVEGTGDVPVVTGDLAGSVVEDTKSVVSGTLVVTDPDWGQSGTDRTNYHQPLPSDNGYGQYEIDARGHWKFTLDQTNSTVQSLVAGQPLTDSFTVTTLDGSKQSIAINITGTNDAATIAGQDIGSVTEDQGRHTTVAQIETSGDLVISDPDGSVEEHFQTQANVIGSNGYGRFSVRQDGHWTYSANNGQTAVQQLNQGQSLTDSVTVTSTDGTTHQVQITIHGTNDAPVLSAATASATEDGSAVSGQMSTKDVDKGDTQHYTLGQSAPDGFSMKDDGSWSFDPTDAAYQHLAEGTKQQVIIPVTVTDGTGATDTENLVITVTGTNDAPVVQPGDIGATQPGASKTLSANDLLAAIQATDKDTGAQLSISDVQIDPKYGSFHRSGTDWVFTPAFGAHHTDVPVTISVTDGRATRSTTAALDVTAAPTPTTATHVQGSGSTHLSGTLSGSAHAGWSIENGQGHGVVSLAGQYGTLTIDPQTGHFDYHYNANSGVIKNGGSSAISGRHTDTFHVLQHGVHTSDAEVQVNINIENVHGHSGHHVDHTSLIGIDIVPIVPTVSDEPVAPIDDFDVVVTGLNEVHQDGIASETDVMDTVVFEHTEVDHDTVEHPVVPQPVSDNTTPFLLKAGSDVEDVPDIAHYLDAVGVDDSLIPKPKMSGVDTYLDAVGGDSSAIPPDEGVNPDLIFDDLDNAETEPGHHDILQSDDVLDVFDDPGADQITPPDPDDTPQGV